MRVLLFYETIACFWDFLTNNLLVLLCGNCLIQKLNCTKSLKNGFAIRSKMAFPRYVHHFKFPSRLMRCDMIKKYH